MTEPGDPTYQIPPAPRLPHGLGRHVHHDPRSRAFAFTAPDVVPVSVSWPRRVPIFDQGSLGSCTGNAAAGWLATDNALRAGLTLWDHTEVNEDFAVSLYSRATNLDPYDGTYPPEDTGSDGLSVTKVLQFAGAVDSYQHCFDVPSVLAALQFGPILVGTAWHNDMFNPDGRGLVKPTGAVVGGHEYLLCEYDATAQEVVFANSWGAGWGVHGYGRMTVASLAALLADDGDATVPHALVNAPVPTPPEPPAPQPPGRFVQLDADVAARVARAAARRGLTADAWVSKHLRAYFRDT